MKRSKSGTERTMIAKYLNPKTYMRLWINGSENEGRSKRGRMYVLYRMTNMRRMIHTETLTEKEMIMKVHTLWRLYQISKYIQLEDKNKNRYFYFYSMF